MIATDNYVDIPPCTDLIRAMIDAEDMSLKKACAELIVNAIDHHAKRVELSYRGGMVLIQDDGSGPPKGLQKLAEIGRHIPSKSDPVGRFGVGHKDATCWLANLAEVHSMTRAGIKERMRVNWARMMEIEKWRFWIDGKSSRTSHGLTIILAELRPYRFMSWHKLPKYIAELFGAAIDSGVTITVDGEAVQSLPLPELDEKVTFQGEHDGLKFRGFAGLLKDKGAATSGWDVRYGPQSIASGYVREGFGSISPQGFYGRFEMINGSKRWSLTRNKTDSEDLYHVLNCEAMQKVIQPLMKKIKERGASLKIQMNMKLVSNALTNMLQKAKVKIEQQEEAIREPNKNGSLLVNGANGHGRKSQESKPGTRKQLPAEEVRRPKRVYDPLSSVKDKIRQAQTINIRAHYDARKGFFFLDVQQHGRDICVYIDSRTPMGARLWEKDCTALLHYAVMCLSAYFGLGVSILNQLRLPLGDCGDPSELKISKALSYLLENIDIDQFTK